MGKGLEAIPCCSPVAKAFIKCCLSPFQALDASAERDRTPMRT